MSVYMHTYLSNVFAKRIHAACSSTLYVDKKCLVGLSYAILLISIHVIVLLGSQGIFESIMARLKV